MVEQRKPAAETMVLLVAVAVVRLRIFTSQNIHRFQA